MNRGFGGWLAAAALTGAGAAAAVTTARRLSKEHLPVRRGDDYVTTRVVTVDRPLEQLRVRELDGQWLAVVLDRPVTVQRRDDRQWRCVTGEPGSDGRVEADVQPAGDSVRWRVESGPLAHHGSLTLVSAPGGRGTELRAELTYPGNPLRHRIRQLIGDDPDQLLRTVLRRAKSMIESGQVLDTLDDPSGRGPVAQRSTAVIREKLATGGRP